jgi:MerR family mercuric resistance operon transcriptional regulator
VSGRGLRTGELAERAGVKVQTLRYYERRGLLAAPARRPSGQREYSEDTVGLLRTIKAAQRLGSTLAEVDAKIAQPTRVRRALLAVLEADCDSLTDCSCGLGRSLPDLAATGPGGAGGLA